MVSSALMPSFSNSFWRTAVSATVVGQKVLVGRPTRMVSADESAGTASSASAANDAAEEARRRFISFSSRLLAAFSPPVAAIVNRKPPFLQLTLQNAPATCLTARPMFLCAGKHNEQQRGARI